MEFIQIWQKIINCLMNNLRFGFYKVGNDIVFSKIEALELADRKNSPISWHYNDDVFDSIDWKIEPKFTLSEIYKLRAQQIRKSYNQNMHILDCIKVLSPVDVVVLTLETQNIVKKDKVEDCIPASFLIPLVERFVHLGEFPTRNVTYWNVTEGKDKEEIFNWEERLIKELTSSNMTISIQELDNTKDVVKVSCEIYMLAHNCMQLTKELLKEVKCAKVLTAFGPIEVEI